jgi:ribulose-5-phosphate 4-epimerase/fuculose-1-phosphate aldolase
MTIMRSLARRHVLIGVGATVAAIATARSAGAQTSSPTSAGPADPALIEDLVAANRILADQGVLDGYGHVSVRHNSAPDRYLMSRSIAPELVTTADIMEYDLASGAMTDMLVRDAALGQALARALGGAPVVLMRGHGAVVVGTGLPVAVFRSVYTEVNARLQAQAMALGGPVTYLDPEEAKRAEASVSGTIGRPWELWKRKAQGK